MEGCAGLELQNTQPPPKPLCESAFFVIIGVSFSIPHRTQTHFFLVEFPAVIPLTLSLSLSLCGSFKAKAKTMEGLPPGYRPNVGICLINSDTQVTPAPFSFYFSRFLLWGLMINCFPIRMNC